MMKLMTAFQFSFFIADHGFKCLVFNLSPRRGDGYSPSLPSGLSPPADGVSPPWEVPPPCDGVQRARPDVSLSHSLWMTMQRNCKWAQWKLAFKLPSAAFSYAKKLQMSAMKACFQIAECSFFLCKVTALLRVNYTLMGIGLKKSAKKWWITYKIVNNLALDGRKFLCLRYNVCHVSVSHWESSVTYRENSVSHWLASCSILSLAK